MNADKNIKSKCDLFAMLNRAPNAKTDDNGVMFQHYDMDPEGEVVVEHTITSDTPLTRADVKLLKYLLEHADGKNNVILSGTDVITVLGYSQLLFDSCDTLQQVEIRNRVIHVTSERQAEHRFGIIEYITFIDETNDCSNWYEMTGQTQVRIKLYDRFCDVYLRHNIADLETSVDETVLANQKLVKAAEREVAEVRSAMKKKEAETKLAAEIASAVLPE